jgi:DNA primase catalytic core
VADRVLLVEAHRAAQEFYERELLRARGLWPAQYLAARRLDHVIAIGGRWPIGYAPDGWSKLVDHLRSQGLDDATLMEAGLATVTRNGYLIDRFRDRLMFAAHDARLDMVGFVGRGRGGPVRYLNSPTTSVYEKSATLIGVAEQQDLLSRGGIPVFVEGPTDALAVDVLSRSTRSGWVGIAPSGTALSASQVAILDEFATSEIAIVATDGDTAGRAAAIRWLEPLSSRFPEVLCAEIPAGHDPSSLFSSRRGADRLHQALSFPRPLLDVAIDAELSRWSRVVDHISGRVGALRAVAPLVVRLPKERVAAEILRLSRLLELDEASVSRELIRVVDQPPRRTSGSARGQALPDPEPPSQGLSP